MSEIGSVSSWSTSIPVNDSSKQLEKALSTLRSQSASTSGSGQANGGSNSSTAAPSTIVKLSSAGLAANIRNSSQQAAARDTQSADQNAMLARNIEQLDSMIAKITGEAGNIRDSDLANAYSGNLTLSQASQTRLSQANQPAQGVLGLLK